MLAKFSNQQDDVLRNYVWAASYLETYWEGVKELEDLLIAVDEWLGSSENGVGLATAMKDLLRQRASEGWICGKMIRWIDDAILTEPEFGGEK